MLKDVTGEILELSRDLKFVRNLSLTFILTIACTFALSDLQSKSTAINSKDLPAMNRQ